MAFDLLMADGDDLRAPPLRERKAAPGAKIGKGAECWIALHERPCRRRAGRFTGLVEADWRASSSSVSPDAYHPNFARWHKILIATHSQSRPGAEGISSAARDAMSDSGFSEERPDPHRWPLERPGHCA